MHYAYLEYFVFYHNLGTHRYNTVKPVYKGQSGGIIKVAFVDRWPLFRASESICPIFTGRIKTGFCGQETTTRRCPYAQV